MKTFLNLSDEDLSSSPRHLRFHRCHIRRISIQVAQGKSSSKLVRSCLRRPCRSKRLDRGCPRRNLEARCSYSRCALLFPMSWITRMRRQTFEKGHDDGCSTSSVTCDWMAQVADEMQLVHMSLPGTHDAATCKFSSFKTMWRSSVAVRELYRCDPGLSRTLLQPPVSHAAGYLPLLV